MLFAPAAALIANKLLTPNFCAAGLLITTSPGVNIAGTVSLLPDPGTIPPVPHLKNIFVTSGKTDDFNVVKSGRIGIDATANLTVKNVKEIDKTLYYNLIPINEILNTSVKLQIIRDTENIIDNNSINLFNNP